MPQYLLLDFALQHDIYSKYSSNMEAIMWWDLVKVIFTLGTCYFVFMFLAGVIGGVVMGLLPVGP